ncbi:hypothetical protein D3C75_1109830 [compost metagenome]
MRLVGVRYQFDLQYPAPLDILLRSLMLGDGRLHQQLRPSDARDHEVSKCTTLAVIAAHVPAQARINEGKRHDLPLGLATL